MTDVAKIDTEEWKSGDDQWYWKRSYDGIELKKDEDDPDFVNIKVGELTIKVNKNRLIKALQFLDD